MSSLPPIKKHYVLAGIVTLVLVAAIGLGGTSLLTAGTQQPSRAAVVLSPVTMNPGDSLSVYGAACGPHAGTPGNPIVMSCLTLTPSPSATAGVATPTATPVVAPTGTATPAKSGVFAIGARLDAGDSVTLAAWQAKVRAGDNSHSDNQNLLLSVKAGSLSQSVGSAGIKNGAASDAIDGRLQDALASNGRITDVTINDEAGKQCPELISDEAYEYKKFAPFNAAHGTHITMTWVPVGSRFADCGVAAFVTNTDRITDQVEARQVDANFATEVHAEIRAIRQARPGLPVGVQVSTLPPKFTTYSTAQVIHDVDALMDGSGDQPDFLQFFYAGRGSIRDNDSDGRQEADDFIAVLNHYRP